MSLSIFTIHKIIFIFIFIFFFTVLSGCSRDIAPVEKAIEIVKRSHSIIKETSVDQYLKTLLKENGDDIRPVGWFCKKIMDSRYIVSYKYTLYSFDQGTGEKGYFFEVNLDDNSVKDVTSEYQKQLKPLLPSASSEKELAEILIDDDLP